MAESQRKNSYRLEMKVAAEYLAEKFDEIIKKHTANPNPTLDTSLPEQRLPPPQPEKLEKPKEEPPTTKTPKPKKCPNTVPRKQKPTTSTVVSPPQRLKSNTILSKTINVNKQNLTVTLVTARQKKAKSHQQKPTNDLNLENLKKLDSQNIRAQIGTQNYEASSMMVNPSETQSLLDDKNQGTAGQDHGVPQGGDKSTFKKTSDNQKKGGVRSKSTNNQKETEDEPQKTQEVIVEEPHLENHLEAPIEENKGSEEDKKPSLETIERDLIENSEALDSQFFERVIKTAQPKEHLKRILQAFVGLLAGSHESFPVEILSKSDISLEEILKILEKTEDVTQTVKNFRKSVEEKLITEKNIFYTLETLNVSFISLESADYLKSIQEGTPLCAFLQKAIEFYKLYKNNMISEKIKKLNEAKEENDRNAENLQSNQNGITNGAQQINPNENPIISQEKEKETAENTENKEKGRESNSRGEEQKKPQQQEKKNVESKVKQFINGPKEKKIDDLVKMKREIQEIKDQNSRLQWEIERDRKKMERLNELQAIQKDLNENFEMERKFKEYMREKEKNERNYLISVKKDTIEIVKAKKELENLNKKEAEKDLHFDSTTEKKWKQRQEEEKRKEKTNEAKQKIIIVQENREIKKRKAEEEKEILQKEIADSSPQRNYQEQFKELIKKKNELKKEYQTNLTYLPNHGQTNGKSQTKKV